MRGLSGLLLLVGVSSALGAPPRGGTLASNTVPAPVVPSVLSPDTPAPTLGLPDAQPSAPPVSAKALAPPEEPDNGRPEQLRPIDIAQERLYRLYKNRKARDLKRAYDALMDKNFVLARRLSAPFAGDPLFLDYNFWLSGAAFKGEARQALQARKIDEAKVLAEKAISQLLRLETEDPYSPFLRYQPRDLALAELVIADVYTAKKKWVSATQYFERAFQRLSGVGNFEELRPENLGHYAEACAKKRSDLCRPWIQRFNALFPRNSVEIRAISRYYPDVEDMERAPRSVSKATQAYKAPDLDQVAFDAALATYLDAKYKDAVQKLQQFIDEFPRSSFRFRARYWLAQALTLQQEHEKAQRGYDELRKDSPLTWYGLLAAIQSGKELDSSIDGTLPMVTETDSFLQPGEARRLRRAQYFIVEGAYDLAAMELRELKIRDALSSQFLMYLAMLNHEARSYSNSFIVLTQLIQRNYDGAFSSFTLRLVFPTPYMDLVKRYATEVGLDPLLVLSLIKQESAFNPGAGSQVGAVGLMQLMPATAIEVNPDITRADLLSPQVNIQTGARYLKRMLSKFNGNVVLALAAYNAGPNAADRWLREIPQKRGMLEFIESIPYKETREYVGSIIRNYYWYSKRLNGEIPKSLSYFWNIYGPPGSAPALARPSGS